MKYKMTNGMREKFLGLLLLGFCQNALSDSTMLSGTASTGAGYMVWNCVSPGVYTYFPLGAPERNPPVLFGKNGTPPSYYGTYTGYINQTNDFAAACASPGDVVIGMYFYGVNVPQVGSNAPWGAAYSLYLLCQKAPVCGWYQSNSSPLPNTFPNPPSQYGFQPGGVVTDTNANPGESIDIESQAGD